MMPARRFTPSIIPSPLEGVSVDAWLTFLAALEVQPINAISEYGGLGAYDIRARRLVELGYATNLRPERRGGRKGQVCDFILPWTQARFLADPIAQKAAITRSMAMYHRALLKGELKQPDASMAGTLAVLHKGGRGALEKFPDLFEHTRALYEKARGAF